MVGSQFLSIRISEMEIAEPKRPYRAIVAADLPHEDSKLLKDLKNKTFKFIEAEINQRRWCNGQEKINICFTTINNLMEKHNIFPGTVEDVEVMKSMVSEWELLKDDGWFLDRNDTPTIKAALLSYNCKVHEQLDEKAMLKQLQVVSQYMGEVTFE